MNYGMNLKARNRFGKPILTCQNGHYMDQEAYRRGVELFNRAEFFEAHEVLEDVWRAAPAAEKRFLQGLIQIAVALHHHGNRNLAGAQSLLHRGTRNLQDYPENFAGLEIPPLLESLQLWRSALATQDAPPPLPKLRLRRP